MRPYIEVGVACTLAAAAMLLAEWAAFGNLTTLWTIPLYALAGMLVGFTHKHWSKSLPWN